MIENLKDEVWMTHPMYKDYAGSNYGRIKSIERDVYKEDGTFHRHKQENLRKVQLNKDGYLQFNIKNTKLGIDCCPLVHRFVYECFHQCIIPDDLEVNHIDCKRDSNSIENLELLDHQSNVEYSQAKTVGQYTLDGELVKVWKSTVECGRNGFDFGAVAKCCRGEYNTKLGNNIYKGFLWKYL